MATMTVSAMLVTVDAAHGVLANDGRTLLTALSHSPVSTSTGLVHDRAGLICLWDATTGN